MNNKNNIENLIERFFEGTTSNLEEKQLYDFFSKEDIPDELKKYKPVFEYFHSGIIKETTEDQKQQNTVQKKSMHNYKKIIYAVGGIAASILILFSVYSLINRQEENFNPYEGSYIVRNGVRITDYDVIKPELEKAYKQAMLQEKKSETILYETSQRDKYDIPDVENQLEKKYYDLLEDIDNEYVKKELEDIFKSI